MDFLQIAIPIVPEAPEVDGVALVVETAVDVVVVCKGVDVNTLLT